MNRETKYRSLGIVLTGVLTLLVLVAGVIAQGPHVIYAKASIVTSASSLTGVACSPYQLGLNISGPTLYACVNGAFASASGGGGGSPTFDSTSIGQPAATATWTFPTSDTLSVTGGAGAAAANAPTLSFATGAGGAQTGTNANQNGGNLIVTLGAPGTGGSGTAGNYGFFKVVAGTAAAVQTAFQVCPPTGTCFFQVGTGNGNGDINGAWAVGGNLSVNSNSTAAGFALEFNAQADKILNTTTNANTDIQGQLTLTAATNSTQTYTFKTGGLTYTNAPTCVVSAQSSLLGGATSWGYTVSNTALVITQTGVSTSSVIYDYICFGHGV